MPGSEAVTIDMAKAQCRAEDVTTDDELFLDLIQSAREHVERYCDIAIVAANATMTFSSFAALERLTRAPVQSITEIRYLDSSGTEQLLDASVYELLDVNADPLRPAVRLAYGQSWPAVRPVEDAVRVTAVVGYAAVPRAIVRAMLVLISNWYDNRSGMAVDVRGTPTELPHAVTALLTNFRR